MSKTVVLSNDQLTVEISSLGAELVKITGCGGTEFLWCGDEKVWSGRAPVLFPICGGLKEDRYTYHGQEYHLNKHGYGKLTEFLVESASDKKVVFLHQSNEETLELYPFSYEFRVIYELKENALEVAYQVNNFSNETMYFSVGAHEAYACPEGIEEYSVVFDKPETLNAYRLNGNLLEDDYITVLENDTVLPLQYTYFAVDALVFKNIASRRVTLVHQNSTKRVTLEFDGFPYFLLWTKPNANYICLEPWCGIQDVVGSSYDLTKKEGIIPLEEGKEFSVKHKMLFEE